MFAEQMRLMRQKRGMTQQGLADMLEVSVSAVQKWERGQAEPNARTLQRMADLFGVSMDELCDRPVPESNVTVMTRALRQMTPEEQEQLIAVGRALFRHAFGEGNGT
ncbi:MAG: helix-turn-helix domain-containing protein [Aristaeellaceae bacterium]